MKNVVYMKRDLSANKGRAVSIREILNDKDCDSRIIKNYVYLVRRVDSVPEEIPKAQINVVKNIDTDAQEEMFRLRVKGMVFIKQNRFVYRIDYCHSLLIRMVWKTHVLSSQDPAALA